MHQVAKLAEWRTHTLAISNRSENYTPEDVQDATDKLERSFGDALGTFGDADGVLLKPVRLLLGSLVVLLH